MGPWRCAALADAAEGSPPTEWAHGDAPARFSDVKLDESTFIFLTFIFLCKKYLRLTSASTETREMNHPTWK